MWIARFAYERMRADLDQLRADHARQLATIEWMRVRLNQSEAERGALFAKVAQIPIVIPTIQRAPADERSPLEAREAEAPEAFWAALGTLTDDMGDSVAERMGIRHDTDGAVVYDK